MRYLQAGITAGIDAPERRQVHPHVQRQAVVTASFSHPHTQGRDLAAVQVYARHSPATLRVQFKGRETVDDRLFQQVDVPLYGYTQPLQVNERVYNQLAGAMVSHLPAPVRPAHGDGARVQQVFGLARHAQGENRLMLQAPDLILGLRAAPAGEPDHGVMGALVMLQTELPD